MALRTSDPSEIWAYFDDGGKVSLPAAYADQICAECRQLIAETPADCCWPCTWDLSESQEYEYRQLQVALEQRVRAEIAPPASIPAARATGPGSHPLTDALTEAARALRAWEKPGDGQLIPELLELLPGLSEAAGEMHNALSEVADRLSDSPVSPQTVSVLRNMAEVCRATYVDEAWNQVQIGNKGDIDRHERPRVNEQDANYDPDAAVVPAAVSAATRPAPAPPPDRPEPLCAVDRAWFGNLEKHPYDPSPGWNTGGTGFEPCWQPRNAPCHRVETSTDDQGRPKWTHVAGVVACNESGCKEVYVWDESVPTTDVAKAVRAANESAMFHAELDAGWYLLDNGWIGCPSHPGRLWSVQVICEWTNGDNVCYASHIDDFPGTDFPDAHRRAVRHLVKNKNWTSGGGYVGCPNHPRQWVPIPAKVLDARPGDLARRARSGEAYRYRLTGGRVADVFRVHLNDGTSMVEKRAYEDSDAERPVVDQQDAEELGAAVLRALGLSAPEVIRLDRDTVIMTDMPGKPAASAWPSGREWSEQETAWGVSDVGLLIGAGDLVIDNHDRHCFNWLIDASGDGPATASLVDHGLAFSSVGWRDDDDGTAPAIMRGEFAANFVQAPRRESRSDRMSPRRWVDNPLHPDDAAEIKRRLESVRPEFERMDRLDWYQFALNRADVLISYATGTERITWPTSP